jgi:ubiquinone/menaquinone biosynthesis C-methylase UbiE
VEPPAWPVVPRYRRDLFVGAARWYQGYRPAYPAELVAALDAELALGERTRVLDLACGTGQVAWALADRVGAIVAIDQEPAMIDAAHEEQARRDASGVSWRVERAEDLDEPAGSFDLVTVGNAFHRLHRVEIAAKARQWLTPTGAFCVLGSDSLTSAAEPWERVVWSTLHDHTPRATSSADTADTADELRLTHEEVLREAGFRDVHELSLPVNRSWTVEEITGFVYSTSVAATLPAVARSAFEDDLRSRLGATDDDAAFTATTTFFYVLGHQP